MSKVWTIERIKRLHTEMKAFESTVLPLYKEEFDLHNEYTRLRYKDEKVIQVRGINWAKFVTSFDNEEIPIAAKKVHFNVSTSWNEGWASDKHTNGQTYIVQDDYTSREDYTGDDTSGYDSYRDDWITHTYFEDDFDLDLLLNPKKFDESHAKMRGIIDSIKEGFEQEKVVWNDRIAKEKEDEERSLYEELKSKFEPKTLIDTMTDDELIETIETCEGRADD